MELREIYKIIKANMSVVIYTILILVVVAYALSVRRAATFSSSLLLNISRTETQVTNDYRFDQFYRLQADEKFSETVGVWLKDPGISMEILEKAGISDNEKSLRQLSKSFRAEKVSSETVAVRFDTESEADAKKISDAIGSVIDAKVKSLNVEARDPNWFKIVPSNFITRRNIQDLRINLALAAAAGLIFGSFFALLRHYVSETRISQ